MKDYRVYLVHILEAIRKIRKYTIQGRDSFFGQDMAQDAVVRNLEIIGEATKRTRPDYWRSLPTSMLGIALLGLLQLLHCCADAVAELNPRRDLQ